MRHQGRITSWKDDQGFGFITPNDGGEQVFVHVKAFSGKKRRPAGNEIVTYELAVDRKSRARAENVTFVGNRARPACPGAAQMGWPAFTVFFVVSAAAAVLTGKLPAIVAGLYLVASAAAFIVYAFDKAAAQKGRRRTPESRLHLLALAGGWPGALAAQRLLRHKSGKPSFQSAFRATVVLNCGVLIWLMTPYGAGALHSVFAAAA